ncbi:hypothetical protein [Halochromatium roseum]|uniref:hypothetical protein n=1 Tax=Halochromatium roseum TaxID=391920 RepID=UPI001913DEE5|nr:hypothetical protein [Halochromatium roseum]
MMYIYEEPSSLELADWEVFRDKMRDEVARFPDRFEAADALHFAEETLQQLKALHEAGRREVA